MFNAEKFNQYLISREAHATAPYINYIYLFSISISLNKYEKILVKKKRIILLYLLRVDSG